MPDVEFAPRSWSRAEVEATAQRYRTWHQWGEDDELGSANYNSPQRVRSAAALVRSGKTFSLALPFDRAGPQAAESSRVNPQHVMLRIPADPLLDDGGVLRFADDAVYMPLQCGTQWDALCHCFHQGQTYNGRGFDSVRTVGGAQFNSIVNVKDKAVGRGVLLDIARWAGRPWLDPGESIRSEHLQRCADAQGVEVGEGDFLLVRTGQIAQVRTQASGWGSYAGGSAPGLGVDSSHFLCSRRITAVATDTWGLEAKPYECSELGAPLHVILLVNAGVLIGEMWDLEALAEDCAEDGQYEFLLAAQPLPITGAVGSPLNPVAIK